jgi:D-serine deaminase-like pyridoxal phosphate-dependent protein
MKISKPTMIIDPVKVVKNIKKMAEKTAKAHCLFRPHFKTHQSVEIGHWFRSCGVQAITVSSIDMANFFLADGWQNITVAIVINPRQIEEISVLAKKCRLNLLVDSLPMVALLEKTMPVNVNVWIKIDTGYGRTGIDGNDWHSILEIAKAIDQSAQLSLAGILTHTGQSYSAKGREDLSALYDQVKDKMQMIRNHLHANGLSEVKISLGDTPSCQVCTDFSGIDEIRTGNFIFNDLMQVYLGSCDLQDVAMAVACPVIGKYTSRKQLVIYGGAVHLSKDYVISSAIKIYGLAQPFAQAKFDWRKNENFLIGISQEHSVIQAGEDLLASTKVGDLLYVIPAHSCLTADLLKKYYYIHPTLGCLPIHNLEIDDFKTAL